MKRLQHGDIDYKEASAASAIRNKFEVDGIKAEQNAAVLKVRTTRKIPTRNNCTEINELIAKVESGLRAQGGLSIFIVS